MSRIAMAGLACHADVVLTPVAPSHLSIAGDKAYAVFPTVIADRHNGMPMTEHGAFVFALDKSGGAWHIASWTWATR
ncbi:MAG TPA: hypothetical protein VII49_07625 [Rhizomicrobium sp.]